MEKNKEEMVADFIDAQVEKWRSRKKSDLPVITFSVSPGSGGLIIARRVAEVLKFDFFDRDIINMIAEHAHISDRVILSIEKERLSGIKDFIASLVDERYLYPGIYLEHLMNVVGVLAKHGHAVIVGRGANFIIPPAERLSVRVVAPLELRVQNIAQAYEVPMETARRRVLHRESRRAAFVKQSFHTDVADPENYDLVINTAKSDNDANVGAIIGAISGGKKLIEKNCLK
jgi:hypothetical protein